MLNDRELRAANLAELNSNDEPWSRRLVGACVDAVRVENAQLNCFTHLDGHGAITAATSADERRSRHASLSPLDGVPIAIKDNIAVQGLPHRAGMQARSAVVADTDAAVVAALKAAGAVILGLTNMDEAAWGAATRNPWFGPCQNPVRAGFTAGGSSGGSAAAVAAELCTLALGTDTLGSIRIPAAYCGIVGFKPSHDALPLAGIVPVSERFDQVGPLTRSCRDARLAFDVLRRASGADMSSAESVQADRLRQLTLGVPVSYCSRRCEPAIARRLEQVSATLKSAGWKIVAVELGLTEIDRVWRAALVVCELALGQFHRVALRERPHEVSRELRDMTAFAERKLPAEIAAAHSRIAAAAASLVRAFDQCDVLLTPTTPQVAFPLSAAGRGGQADFTFLANLTGGPALSLPAGVDDQGLPIGMQLIGRASQDLQLLDLGCEMEPLL